MKKYGVLFLLNLLVLFSINRYYQYSEDVPQPLAYRFTFICPQTWDDVAAGMEEADRDLGTDTKYVGFKNSNEGKQAEAIRSAVYAKADGIITVGNNNSKVIGAAVEEAEEAGIPVILMDSDLEGRERSGYIGMDHKEAGKLAGEDMIAVTGGNAHIGMIVSDTDDSAQRLRMEGFLSAINPHKNMIVEETFESRSDRIRIRKLVSGMLQDNKRINAIFCADQTAADMLGDILQEEGYSKNNMKVVCFGMSREIYKYLQDGTYTFSVMNDTEDMGYQAVKTLKDCINGKSGEKRIVYTEIENADKDFDFESWKAERENRERSCMMS